MEPFPNVDPGRRVLDEPDRPLGYKPEMAVRRAAHSLGYRFRLHRKDFPGTPDLVFFPPSQGHTGAWVLLASAPRLQAG
jgi:hypothetical protein